MRTATRTHGPACEIGFEPMIREHLFEKRLPTDPLFRWRGGGVSRVEGFSDGVFAVILTLLIAGRLFEIAQSQSTRSDAASRPTSVTWQVSWPLAERNRARDTGS
jgi:hypothetical protein